MQKCGKKHEMKKIPKARKIKKKSKISNYFDGSAHMTAIKKYVSAVRRHFFSKYLTIIISETEYSFKAEFTSWILYFDQFST